MGALKVTKAVKYFKEGYVQNLKTHYHPPHCYVSSQTKASMKNVHYEVEICLNLATADVLAAKCPCPADEWPSVACSHVAATLFAIEDYVAYLQDPGTCTSRLQQWHKPRLQQHNPTPICDATFRKQSCKLDEQPHKERVLRPTIKMFDPRPHHQRGISFDRFESFEHELKRSGLKCGWLLQITPASSDAQHEVYIQFPLTQKERKIACSKLLEALTVSDEESVEIELQTRG